MEIGVDLTDIQRFIDLIDNKRVLQKIFTEQEILYCKNAKNPAQHFAARFAGKEAVIKAFYPYGVKLVPNQIEILNSTEGIPQVRLQGVTLDQYRIKISLSHSDETAVAFVMVDLL